MTSNRHRALELYRKTYRAFLTDDGVIDDKERGVLDEIAQREGLGVDDLNAIHERVGQDSEVRVRLAQLQAEDPAYQVYELVDTQGPLSGEAIVEALGAEDEARWQAALEDLLFDAHVVAAGHGASRRFYSRDAVISQCIDALQEFTTPQPRAVILSRAGLPEGLWEVIVTSLYTWGMMETHMGEEEELLYTLTPSFQVHELLSLEGPLTEAEITARLGADLWSRALGDPHLHAQLCNLGEDLGFMLRQTLMRRVLRLLSDDEGGLTRDEIIQRLGWGEAAWPALKEYVLDTEHVDADLGVLASDEARYRPALSE